MVQERVPDQLAPTRPMSLRAPDPTALEWQVRCEADKAQVIRYDGTDAYIADQVRPIIGRAFTRYTSDGKGNDDKGVPVPWQPDQFDQTYGKTTYIVAQAESIPLAALRVVKSWVPPYKPAIDAMTLMTGHEWPDPTKTRFAEVGHFALDPRVDKQRGLILQRKLYEEVMRLAQAEGFAGSIYVILGHVKGFVEESGIKVQEISGAYLNWGNHPAREIFGKHPRYFLPVLFPEYNNNGKPSSPPKLYYYGV
ncbi:MAG TPA: hypothetical protein VMW29_00080 [Candidatus Bathyarchaeia archaeon]|nr:hypothetical protein [Candidatus Bathyarchaeia archaeon]